MAFCGVSVIVLPSRFGHRSTISLSRMAASANFMGGFPAGILVLVGVEMFY